MSQVPVEDLDEPATPPEYVSHTIPSDVVIPEEYLSQKAVRGAGPGGQGMQSSSNKVELRLDVNKLVLEHGGIFDLQMIHGLQRNGRLTASDEVVVTSHRFRSALKNREDCMKQMQAALHEASYTPPPIAEPIKLEVSKDNVKRIQRHRVAADKRKATAGVRKLKSSPCG